MELTIVKGLDGNIYGIYIDSVLVYCDGLIVDDYLNIIYVDEDNEVSEKDVEFLYRNLPKSSYDLC